MVRDDPVEVRHTAKIKIKLRADTRIMRRRGGGWIAHDPENRILRVVHHHSL